MAHEKSPGPVALFCKSDRVRLGPVPVLWNDYRGRASPLILNLSAD